MSKALGKRIRSARNVEGYSQTELGRKVGVSQSTVVNWESGKTAPNEKQVKLIEKFLGKMTRGRSASIEIELQNNAGAFGAWLRSAREAKGWSRQTLSEKSQISVVGIYNIETQRIVNPQAATRASLSSALGESVPQGVAEEDAEDQDIKGIGALVGFDPYDNSSLPTCSGVYVFYDVSERPIYVGKATDISKRVKSHGEKFWFKRPIVEIAYYIEISNDALRHQIEQVLIKFMRKNAVINLQSVER